MTGVAFAISAAAFWAVATTLYRQMSGFWTPAGLAFVKSIISVSLFLIWFVVADVDFWRYEQETLAWLFVSGVVGIALGDTVLFYALYRMTERETLLVAETAAPILVILAAFGFMAETLTLLQLMGIGLVLVGVDSVLGLRHGSAHFDRVGVVFALVAAVCQAFGMLVSRYYLTETDISAAETAFWRLLGAACVLPVWITLRREHFLPAQPLSPGSSIKLGFAILLGTFLGILFLQISVQRLPAGLAQALIATSIIFATIIGALRGEQVTRGQWLGVALAVMGVSLVVI